MQHDAFVIPGGFRYFLLHFPVVEQAFLKGKRNFRRVIRMTEREKEIIALIVDRMSNKQIAGRLNISVCTLKSHIHNVLENWRDIVVFRL
jgi:ATP/maltotriose-dependent transcriptional regulator MalT